MPFVVSTADAEAQFPEYTFLTRLTPSEQKAAFHVKDRSGRDLCLKLIAPQYSMDRLSREIHALQTIVHPNIVKLVEYTYSATAQRLRHFMVEEFIHGDDLAAHLSTTKLWSIARAASFFGALASGLEKLRSARVVHRDLKPTNIRVRSDDTPVIIDFGLARHLDLPDITKTAEGAAIGTPAYFAPEQFTGTKRDIDHRTDLFAFGVLMYQCVVGHHPFFIAGRTWSQLARAVCESDAHFGRAEFRKLPSGWQLMIRKLLAKQRADRPCTAAQVKSIMSRLGVAP